MEWFDGLSDIEKQRVLKLSEQFTKFPLSVATPIHFGDYWRETDSATINNGTGTLLKIGSRQFCITNQHVLKKYRERKADDSRIVFQLGNLRIDPEKVLVSESVHYDLAVLDLENVSATDIATDGDVPTQFMYAPDWPPVIPKPGGFVLFGGYPGCWREPTGRREVRFDTLSSGASEVHAWARARKTDPGLHLKVTHQFD